MEKHIFLFGHGMKKETSTPEERKEIYQLLHTKGYRVKGEGKERDLLEFERDLVHNGIGFILPHLYNSVIKDHTYQEMKDLILGNENPCMPGNNTVTGNISDLPKDYFNLLPRRNFIKITDTEPE